MTAVLLDHVQAVHSPYEAANSRESIVGRWRITPVPLGRRGYVDVKPYSGSRR
jgi:hypothetical protein